jgi:hypothetical protein
MHGSSSDSAVSMAVEACLTNGGDEQPPLLFIEHVTQLPHQTSTLAIQTCSLSPSSPSSCPHASLLGRRVAPLESRTTVVRTETSVGVACAPDLPRSHRGSSSRVARGRELPPCRRVEPRWWSPAVSRSSAILHCEAAQHGSDSQTRRLTHGRTRGGVPLLGWFGPDLRSSPCWDLIPE